MAWLANFARLVHRKLKDDGSFVLDLGGACEPGSPTRSLYNFRVPIHFCDELGFHLAEDFYWHNPSKLPSPIEWVNKRKLRAKDSVNTVWWFGKTRWPKADVLKVLTEYSDRMKKLLEDPAGFYTPKKRPSGHNIGKAFAKDTGGAIPPNLLKISNSESNGSYLRGCKTVGVKGHPARFLTEPGDLVVDIFGGSNTTGSVAECEGRKWLAFEHRLDYLAASSFRFFAEAATDAELKVAHHASAGGGPSCCPRTRLPVGARLLVMIRRRVDLGRRRILPLSITAGQQPLGWCWCLGWRRIFGSPRPGPLSYSATHERKCVANQRSHGKKHHLQFVQCFGGRWLGTGFMGTHPSPS